MINGDFVELSRYRSDGRKHNEMRRTEIKLGVDATADGSCLLQQGLTEVLCLVYGPYQKQNNNDNLLKLEYTVAPLSSLEKRRGKYDKEFSEFTENVRRSFEGVIIGEVYKKHQIEVVVSVIQNEGSAKSTVINCITLGLANAGIAMRDLLISCTAGMLYGNVLIDTNEDEEYDVTNELTLSYLNSERKMDCLEVKKAKIREEELTKIYELAVLGCKELYARLRKMLIDYSFKKMLIF